MDGVGSVELLMEMDGWKGRLQITGKVGCR